MMKRRRTKIIATLGPASSDPKILKKLIKAGVDLVRINLSHGDKEQHQQLIDNARACARTLNREIGIIADLQGPKIRIGHLKEDKKILTQGEAIILDCGTDPKNTDAYIPVNYDLSNDVHVGDTLLLDDGRIGITVTKIDTRYVHCLVNIGGELRSRKGLDRQGKSLSAEALTEKDKQDIKNMLQLQIDYIALSFVRDKNDIDRAKQIIEKHKGKVGLIAKIERREALKHLDDIIQATDAVMIARGDLGVATGAAEVPALQKLIIDRARALDRAVITATQMMESMIQQPIPTRAEVSDVANAVLDGSDAVMLSAETASGQYPVEVVTAMADVCLTAEKQPSSHTSKHRLECTFHRIDEAIAMASMYTANHLAIKAIICLSESGATPLWMSRIRSSIPIYGLSRHVATQRKITLYRGVYPIDFDPTTIPHEAIAKKAIATLMQLKHIQPGDRVIITQGECIGEVGHTNCMCILQV